MNNYESIKRQARMMLSDESKDSRITDDRINEVIDAVVLMFKMMKKDSDIDKDLLFRELQGMFNTFAGESLDLIDDKDHEVWLPDRKGELDWLFWKRYRQYLEEDKNMPPAVTSELNVVTDKILGYLEDPKRPGKWDRRGMVVGQVQSGKTSNYTGLICKAVDAGYKLVIVLAGMHNNLRSQTQLRLDEGFLGFDTELNRAFDNNNRRIGVGTLENFEPLIVHALTSSEEKGDYNTRVAKNVNFMIGSDPVLLVVKKNATVLKNLISWLDGLGTEEGVAGEKKINSIPLLVIDDEADNASVDTKAIKDENGKDIDGTEPAKINQQIRKLLKLFNQSAYVGYTATPFANIFIYPPNKKNESKWGEDLFPRSFIINLTPPSNYIGPSKMFGLGYDEELGLEKQERLPIIKTIDDYNELIPNNHKKGYEVTGLPKSLKDAIRYFIISCAARIVRSQGSQHNSMLVHVTRFTDTQKSVADLIELELDLLRKEIEFGDGHTSNSVIEELKEIWNKEYAETTQKVKKIIEDSLITELKWDDVKNNLYKAVSKIQLKTINGTAGDVLDYRNNPNGLYVIAVGGDKLSRGLTLEGLIVSYYLRASKMYDTLMQMGRWFGYRPGYLDLCRLFTTSELCGWYEHIAKADEELRQEFEFMVASGSTPMNYGLKVRSHPDGLKITAANKIKSGTKLQISFAGSLCQTTHFYKDKERAKRNFLNLQQWLKTLYKVDKDIYNNYYIWGNRVKGMKVGNLDITHKQILEFLQGIEVHPFARNADTGILSKYIMKQVAKDELKNWTVVLVSKNNGPSKNIADYYDVGMVKRTENTEENENDNYWRVKRSQLISQKHEYIDMSSEEVEIALEKTREAYRKKYKDRDTLPTMPSGRYIRELRKVERGLLLIYLIENTKGIHEYPLVGFAISFPDSEMAECIEYVVDTTYWRNMYGED